MKQHAILVKSLAVFNKLNKYLPCDTIILLLGIYLREKKAQVHTKVCTEMFVVA